MNKWMFPLCLAFSLGAGAQTLQLKGTYAGSDAAPLSLVAKPMGTTSETTVKLTTDKNKFEGAISVSKDGFYQLYGVNNDMQLIVPFYWPDAGKPCKMKLQLQNGCPMIDAGKDNKALSAFNALTYERGRFFWTKGMDMDQNGVKQLLKSYTVSADSLAKRYGCSAPVKQYLNLWAYVTTYSSYESWASKFIRNSQEAPLKLSEVLEEPYKVLDTPMASYFPTANYLIYQTIPNEGSFEERLAYLTEHYQSAEIRKTTGDLLADHFVLNFDFSGDFEAGLTRLQEATAKFGLDANYVENFKKRKSSAKGKPFPGGITLTDAEGNKVDFASFKGRYVYIDLWASWCGPCVKEVPFLQELEKTLENKDVVFVSISLDKNEKAWKDKMKALNMHGNQLLNQDNSLAEALNVKGIPYFVIYDKEGQLYMSNAPRPSHPALKELLEGLH